MKSKLNFFKFFLNSYLVFLIYIELNPIFNTPNDYYLMNGITK